MVYAHVNVSKLRTCALGADSYVESAFSILAYKQARTKKKFQSLQIFAYGAALRYKYSNQKFVRFICTPLVLKGILLKRIQIYSTEMRVP